MRKRRKRRMRRRREKERENSENRENREDTERIKRDTKHLCSCADDSQDHNRLLVPRSKQALSRRLQIPSSTHQKNLLNG